MHCPCLPVITNFSCEFVVALCSSVALDGRGQRGDYCGFPGAELLLVERHSAQCHRRLVSSRIVAAPAARRKLSSLLCNLPILLCFSFATHFLDYENDGPKVPKPAEFDPPLDQRELKELFEKGNQPLRASDF